MVRKQTKNAEEARWLLHTVRQLFRGRKIKTAIPVGDSRFGDYFKPTFFL